MKPILSPYEETQVEGSVRSGDSRTGMQAGESAEPDPNDGGIQPVPSYASIQAFAREPERAKQRQNPKMSASEKNQRDQKQGHQSDGREAKGI